MTLSNTAIFVFVSSLNVDQLFNPAAFRKAKITYSLGISGCNRIKNLIMYKQILSSRADPIKQGVTKVVWKDTRVYPLTLNIRARLLKAALA